MKSNCVKCTSLEKLYLNVESTNDPTLQILAYRCLDCDLVFLKAEDQTI